MPKKKTCGFTDEGVSRSVRLSDSHTQFYFYLLLCLALTLFFFVFFYRPSPCDPRFIL